MRAVRSIILSAATVVSLAPVLAENRAMDSYQSIVDRNPFGLKPPPPPAAAPTKEEKPEPKTEFYLAGITTVGYPKHPKAYLVNKDPNKKGNDKYYNLILNERSGDVTLTDIDVKNRKVKIAYRGEDQWLSMKDNGVPASAVPQPPPGVPGAVPHLPGQMPSPLPQAGAAGPAPQQNNLYPSPSINRRIPRTGGMSSGFLPNNSQPQQHPQQQQEALDPAEQLVRWKIDQTIKQKQGIEMPPMPPIPGL